MYTEERVGYYFMFVGVVLIFALGFTLGWIVS
jgi:hypothetical protein